MAKWQFQQIDPALARGTLVEEMWTNPRYVAEEKYDGDRRIAQFCGNVVRFTGRRKSVKDGLYVEKTDNIPHLAGKVIKQASLYYPVPKILEGTVLDGEIVYPIQAGGVFDKAGNRLGGLSKYVTSIMGSLPDEAIAKQIERGWLTYVVFDCLFFQGKDMRLAPLDARRGVMEAVLDHWRNPFAIPAERGQGRAFYDRVVQRGGEGVILKHTGHAYGNASSWVKVKKQATADVVIMGFNDAKKESRKRSGEVSATKYAKAGLIGAIQCGQFVLDESAGMTRPELVEVATVSGMDDALRARLTAHPKRYIGTVIEIEHNGREPTGRFRHPRFNRFRDDKQAKDCIYREGEI